MHHFLSVEKPPYGDNTIYKDNYQNYKRFPPPYGDNTGAVLALSEIDKFPPPYGDNTPFFSSGVSVCGLLCFRPLAGIIFP